MTTTIPDIYDKKIPDYIFNYIFLGKEEYLAKIHDCFHQLIDKGVMKEFCFMYTVASIGLLARQPIFDLSQNVDKIRHILSSIYDESTCNKAVVQIAAYIMQGMRTVPLEPHQEMREPIQLPAELIPAHVWNEFQHNTDRIMDDLR